METEEMQYTDIVLGTDCDKITTMLVHQSRSFKFRVSPPTDDHTTYEPNPGCLHIFVYKEVPLRMHPFIIHHLQKKLSNFLIILCRPGKGWVASELENIEFFTPKTIDEEAIKRIKAKLAIT